MNLKQQFKEGLITNNPVLVQRIGMCSTMAITTTLFNGLGMGISVLIILTCCNVAISALRKALSLIHISIAKFTCQHCLQNFLCALSARLGAGAVALALLFRGASYILCTGREVTNVHPMGDARCRLYLCV